MTPLIGQRYRDFQGVKCAAFHRELRGFVVPIVADTARFDCITGLLQRSGHVALTHDRIW